MLREKKEFQCKCKNARVQKWLEETDNERLRRRQVKATAEHGKGVKEQQRDKNTTARDDEVDYFDHPFRDGSDIEGEEHAEEKGKDLRNTGAAPGQDPTPMEGGGTLPPPLRTVTLSVFPSQRPIGPFRLCGWAVGGNLQA